MPMINQTFGDAIEALKAGERVQRAGWNGKGMWLILLRGVGTHHARVGTHHALVGRYDMQNCIGMKTAQNQMQPGWLASQADILAEDWVIL